MRCSCEIPNRANVHVHVILSREITADTLDVTTPNSRAGRLSDGIGTETTYTDLYLCSDHWNGNVRDHLRWDGHEGWEIIETTVTELR